MTGTALVNYKERFEKEAAEHAAREARSAPRLSLRGGTFTLGQQALGQRVIAVVLDSYFENSYYDPNIPYQEDNPMSPICYAMARDDKHLMRPHESMKADMSWFRPQSAWDAEANWPGTCLGCKWNEWGSAPGRKGKACKNKEVLTLLPGGFFQPAKARGAVAAPELFTDPAHFSKADNIVLSLPVTSGGGWATYVTQLSASHKLPPYAVYTEMWIEPDPKSQYKVKFDMIEALPETLFEIITSRVDAIRQMPFEGYAPPEQRAPFDQTGGRDPRGLAGGFQGRR